MRQKQEQKKPIRRRVAEEPLAEGIVPIDNRGRRSWSSMSDVELQSYARAFIRERGIPSGRALNREDTGLCQVLRKRGLFGGLGFDHERPLKGYPDDELLATARIVMGKEGITSRSQLKLKRTTLYNALKERGLLDEAGLRRLRTAWSSFGDGSLVTYAMKMVKAEGIRTMQEFMEREPTLQKALYRRGLLHLLKLQKRRERWVAMGDDELIERARALAGDRKTPTGLKRKHPGLHRALKDRGLLEEAGLISRRRGYRKWAAMSDGELIHHADKVVSKNGFRNRYALERGDRPLYAVLGRRGLLDEVFYGIEVSREEQGVREVVKALKEFG